MKIEHFALNVGFPVEMAMWYVQHLEMRVTRSLDRAPYTHFLVDESGNAILEIYCNPTDQVPDYAAMNPLLLHLAFVSTNPTADTERLLAAGATLEEELHKVEEFEFGIFEAASGAFLDGVGLNAFNAPHRFCNLGYWVRPSQQKRGIAAQATRLLARAGFADLSLNRIEIVAALENLASQRTAVKAGARREGVLRKRLVWGVRSTTWCSFLWCARTWSCKQRATLCAETVAHGEENRPKVFS